MTWWKRSFYTFTHTEIYHSKCITSHSLLYRMVLRALNMAYDLLTVSLQINGSFIKIKYIFSRKYVTVTPWYKTYFSWSKQYLWLIKKKKKSISSSTLSLLLHNWYILPLKSTFSYLQFSEVQLHISAYKNGTLKSSTYL